MHTLWEKIAPTVNAFRRNQLLYHAGSLTAYGLLSLFPFTLLLVALLGLIGEGSTVETLVSFLRDHDANSNVLAVISDALNLAVERKDAATKAFSFGLVFTLYGASSALAAMGRALNIAFALEERRGWLHRRALCLLYVLPLLLLATLAYALVFLGGQFMRDLFSDIGIGTVVAQIWEYARWPVAAVIATGAFTFLYATLPDHRSRQLGRLARGATLGVALWLIGSIGFYLFVSNFEQLNATYGAFAGAVLLILWLWVTNVALLLGAQWVGAESTE